MLANVAYAAGAESMITFFPLYGSHFGMPQEASLGLMTIMGAGGMMIVLPLGWVVDHVDRMGMLVLMLLSTMACLLAMPHILPLQAWLVFLFAFIFGGVEGMIYALGVILIGERFRGAQLAVATTAFTACWGAGTLLGPLLVGVGMDWFGDGSMPLIIFAMFVVYLPLPLVSWLRAKMSKG